VSGQQATTCAPPRAGAVMALRAAVVGSVSGEAGA